MSFLSDLFDALYIKIRGIGSTIIYNDEEGAVILPENRCKQMALGGPMFVLNYEYMDSIETGTLVEMSSDCLRSSWRIRNRESAIDSIDWIFNQGHRTMVDKILCILHTIPKHQQKEALVKIAEEQEDDIDDWIYKYENIQDCIKWFSQNKLTRGKPLPHSIAAWDYVRAVAVSRWCQECGYVSETEMWKYIDEAQQLAQQKFNSWEEYGLSFALGRGIWGGEEKFKEACKLITILLKKKNSPWLKPWK